MAQRWVGRERISPLFQRLENRWTLFGLFKERIVTCSDLSKLVCSNKRQHG